MPKALARQIVGSRSAGVLSREADVHFGVARRTFGDSDKRLLIVSCDAGSGLCEALRHVLIELERFLNSLDKPFEVTLLIPRWLSSSVIGKKGMNVKELVQTTGCRIQISDDPHKRHSLGNQVCTVNGLGSGILHAIAGIHRLKLERQKATGDEDDDESEEDEADSEIEKPQRRLSGSRGRESRRREASRGRHDRRPPSPPSPWELVENPEVRGEFYYHNTETGKTAWELPDEVDSVSVDSELSVRPEVLPRPWVMKEHPEAPGEYYYLNEDTGVTDWVLPPEVEEEVRALKKAERGRTGR